MKNRFCGTCWLVAFLLMGCSTTYTAYEGAKVVQGEGGTRKTVDGIDIWTSGAPPRKFKVMGVIDDKRRDTWMIKGCERTLAKKAKEVGGHAVVIVDSRKDFVGFLSSGGSGTATTHGTAQTLGTTTHYSSSTTYNSSPVTITAIEDRVTRAVVVQYVDE